MKITYREAFATQLQKNLQAVSAILVEVPEGKDGTPPLSFVEGIIASVEKATNKKITAKSPNWIFDRLRARLDGRLNPDHTSAGDTLRAVVQKSREEAFRIIHDTSADVPGAEKLLEASMRGSEFVSLVDTLKGFVMKDGMKVSDGRLQLVFGKDEKCRSIVDGYACNSVSMAHATASCALVGDAFTVYIDIPRLKPKRNSLVRISLKGKTAHVAFDDVSFSTFQTGNPNDLQAIRNSFKDEEDTKTVLMDPVLLKKMATAMCSGNLPRRVKVTVGGEVSMVSFQDEGAEIFICPMRPTRHYD